MTTKYNDAPQYTRDSLDENTAADDPFIQFRQWYDIASQHTADPTFQPNAMTLATATTDGHVTARIVLLKELDATGFVFYTHYQSGKGQQLQQNPRAALLFYWQHLERQIRIEGITEKITRAESAAYFSVRPRGSQLGAWSSAQSKIVASREILEQQYAAVEQQYIDSEIPLPDHWGGYRLYPVSFEFWQGRNNRLHDRLKYTRQGSVWLLERLSP